MLYFEQRLFKYYLPDEDMVRPFIFYTVEILVATAYWNTEFQYEMGTETLSSLFSLLIRKYGTFFPTDTFISLLTRYWNSVTRAWVLKFQYLKKISVVS